MQIVDSHERGVDGGKAWSFSSSPGHVVLASYQSPHLSRLSPDSSKTHYPTLKSDKMARSCRAAVISVTGKISGYIVL